MACPSILVILRKWAAKNPSMDIVILYKSCSELSRLVEGRLDVHARQILCGSYHSAVPNHRSSVLVRLPNVSAANLNQPTRAFPTTAPQAQQRATSATRRAKRIRNFFRDCG